MHALLEIAGAAVQHFALQALLTQVGQDFQGSRQGIALARGEQEVPLDTPCQHLRQKALENAFCAPCTYIDQVQVVRAEVREIGALEFIIALREHPGQEFVAKPCHGFLVVQAAGNGINCNHSQ